MFDALEVEYSWGKPTEGNKKPDFLFPSVACYRDEPFDVRRLTLLGVKTTCKDRWRQVLLEADRVPSKHLFTLQPRISVKQTKEMRGRNLQLVVPESIHVTYAEKQKNWLWDLEQFVARLRGLQ